MAKATTTPGPRGEDGNNSSAAAAAAVPRNEEEHGLLAGHIDDDDEDGDSADPAAGPRGNGDYKNIHVGALSKSSSGGTGTPRTPRTPNRVRFDLEPTNIPPPANGHRQYGQRSSVSEDDDDGEDDGEDIELSAHDPLASRRYDDDDDDDDDGGGGGGYNGRDTRSSQRLPLLTDIEAPSVTLANSPWGGEGDVHEWAEAERARPKSGLQSAFMNMANSIIGAGIIGQPYAFRQAGLLAGVVLLVALTVIVDWTIRLIVVNSKLSGANSFQGTVEHCFGRPGLIAISVAQWAFAFGGMVAFGVIVGDSIPHVLQAVWPGLRDIPVLGLLADRRIVIAVFIMGISYPLALYRDIAKVSENSVS
jgi:solute carrier family 38 (sodium-coupled neutral amino acid transporter), member 11